MSKKQRNQLAVDIGGTFTDVVLEVAGERVTVKVLTTPSAPEQGVLSGIEDALAQAEIEARAVDLIIHGTTLATNAIIERKGARTALVTTEGFRDVIEIGYESRYNQYDIMIDKPMPLVPRDRRLTVSERIDVHGSVLTPLDEDAVRGLVPAIEHLGVDSVAIGFLHAYANPAHERRAAEILAASLPRMSFTLSSEACPEVREYERFTTTVANAYIRPLMASYLQRLRDRINALGCECPLLLMTSGGGLTTLETAMRFPVRLVESGPAGGAILASRIAAEMALDKVISFDMGGTTAKICIIDDYEPQSAREFEVDRSARFLKGSGLPLRIPVIEMVEIGAGGGSIARIDALGRITIGPDSAGADPGPAAYGRGGENPTVTDADVALGRIDPERFAGGKVALDPSRSAQAIDTVVGSVLELSTGNAAYGIAEMVDETMANAARVHAVERGKVAAEHALVAFGGAAPLHVGRLAEKLGIDRIIVPADAGVGSAVGFLRAPVAYEVVRSRNMRLRDFDAGVVNTLMEEMRAEAFAVVNAGAPGAELNEQRLAYMRYVGQGHEIVVSLPLAQLSAADADTLHAAYECEYRRLYHRVIPDAEIEVLTWALSLASLAEPAVNSLSPAASDAPAPADVLQLFDAGSGQMLDVPLYRRLDLPEGAGLSGPAVITEDATSIFVTARFDARVGANGHIILERKNGSTA